MSKKMCLNGSEFGVKTSTEISGNQLSVSAKIYPAASAKIYPAASAKIYPAVSAKIYPGARG